MLYDRSALHARFDVSDRYVRCVSRKNQENVCEDACVELFVAPSVDLRLGYFNIEVNCGGAMLVHHVVQPATRETQRRWEVLDAEELGLLRVQTTLPSTVDPEHEGPLDWSVMLTVPFELFSKRCGVDVRPGPGVAWPANLYKCARNNSHPHWASWSPLGERLDFHQVDRFGRLWFA